MSNLHEFSDSPSTKVTQCSVDVIQNQNLDTSISVKQRRNLTFAFIIITAFMIVEAIGGWLTQSLALLSDAGHMLSDALALGATLMAFHIGKKSANTQKTFGYKRFEILVAGINGATLIIIAIMIFIEAIKRINEPPEIASYGMLIIAVIGMIINLIAAWILHSKESHDHDHHNHKSLKNPSDDLCNHDLDEHTDSSNQATFNKNLNIHSAYLHVLSDLMGSVAAIIAALLIMWFGWQWADPIASILVALFVLASGYRVVKQSSHILMEGAPQDISLAIVSQTLLDHNYVLDVHDLHIWSITSGIHALSCHVVVDDDMLVSHSSQIINELALQLQKIGIAHVTIQIESLKLHCKPNVAKSNLIN